MTTPSEASIFVIFGGTGDLSKRKLLPALCHLAVRGHLDERSRIIGLGRASQSDESFRELAHEALARGSAFEPHQIDELTSRVHYQPIGEGKSSDFHALRRRIESLSGTHGVPPNRAFYLSLPPETFPGTVAGLGEAGLNESAGWTRLVVEKPFGQDLASAQKLNLLIHRYFSEKQVYRIDHYLGKETVQNLLVFRLANGLIESAWNRERIDSVQITVAEQLGVGSRAGYYDGSGALRDMVQNHLSQLLTLVAMEVPASFDAEAIHFEKRKVLRSVAPIAHDHVVYGQYVAGAVGGESVCGYVDEKGVPEHSKTETFVALKLFVDSWRWQGVPFYLRTGKRLPKQMTQIAVRFREAPVSFFRRLGCEEDTADVLLITLQPDEGFSFYFDIKGPGEPFRLHRIPLRFRYSDQFAMVPEAYQTLIHDVLDGDQTLFVNSEEVEESWRVFMPLLDHPPPVKPYRAGSWGPPEADSFAIAETELWQQGM